MSGGGISGGAAAARVPIPSSLRRTIQDIKEIAAGKHNEDDIYSMLKECNMDPNETAQRLLYLDTFHEVKRKRDKKKVDVSLASEEFRQASGMLRRRPKGGRESSLSSVSEEFGGRKKGGARCENGINNYTENSSRLSAAVIHKRDNNATPAASNSSVTLISDPKNVSSRGVSNETASKLSYDNTSDARKYSSVAVTNMSGKAPPLPSSSVKQLPSAGPTPSNYADTSIPLPGIRAENVTPTSVPGLYSSSADPVLVPPLSPRNYGAVGTVKHENGMSVNATKSISSQSEARTFAGQDVVKSVQVVPETMHSSSKPGSSEPHHIIKHQLPEPPQGEAYGLSKAVASQGETIVSASSRPSLHKSNDFDMDQVTPELDRKLESLSISSHQPVIFPDHLQVPEALRKGLTFGSLDVTLDQSATCQKVSKPTSKNINATDLVGREPSQSNHCAFLVDNGGVKSDCPQSDPQVTEIVSASGDNASPDLAPKSNQPQPDSLSPIAGLQYPLLQTAPEYAFGFMPPVQGPHPVQLEGAEPQVIMAAQSTSGSTPPVTQPSGLAQSSYALPPQLLPFLRQPYPSNFIPYNPYFAHLYMPHNAHQFLGHSVVPQQPTAGNVYAPPTAAAGSKYAVPPLYKTATLAGTIPYFGIPSGYGSYGASTVGYSPSPALTSDSSGGNEDLMASELKEKNIYPALKQNEEPQTWISAAGRDLSTLPANYFYNIPSGQQVAFPPAHSGHGPFAGMYHLGHPLPTAPSVQSLPQQSQAAIPSAESMIPTSTSQQPHGQMNWNNKLLNR